MYDLEKMPKYKAMRKAKRRWKELEKEMDKLFKLEEQNEYLHKFTKYEREEQILRHLEYLLTLSTSFCSYTFMIMLPVTKEEELEEMKKMTKAERRAHDKTMHFFSEIQDTAEQVKRDIKLSEEYLERLKKDSQ